MLCVVRLIFSSIMVLMAAAATLRTRFCGSPINRLITTQRKSSSIDFNVSPTIHNSKIFTISESTVFSGYRDVVQREVLLPNGKSAIYDIVKQKHASVVVFVWDSVSKTTTLVKEYHPGPDLVMHGTVAGMYETDKHLSALHAAQCELDEEAQLQTDKWYPLLDSAAVSMPFDKYSNNTFHPFLALDCSPVVNPKPMDDEEFIEVRHNVTYNQLTSLLSSGQINVVSAYGILLGLRKLEELGIEVRS